MAPTPNSIMSKNDASGQPRHLLLTRLWVLTVGCWLAFMAAAAHAKEPSYEETLVFIEGNARYPLVTHDRRCDLIYRDNLRFSAKDLNPLPVVNGWGATYKCTQRKKCIDPRNSDKLQADITIEAKDINNADKVARAVTHLIQLCGGAKAKSDLF